MTTGRHTAKKSSRIFGFFYSILSGVLVGLSFPPFNLSALIWIALVPLLWVISRSGNLARAVGFGALAGAVALMITTWPLLSSSYWSGWETYTAEQTSIYATRQWWFLHAMWVLFAGLWVGGVFWGLGSGIIYKAGFNRPLRSALVAASAWVLVVEFLRTQLAWGFHWTILGNAASDFAWLRQIGAFGGVWLLSFVIVFVNAALIAFLRRPRHRESLVTTIVAALLVGLALGYGQSRFERFQGEDRELRVAVIQYSKARESVKDFFSFGLNKQYYALAQQTFKKIGKELDLLMLPESVSIGNLSLDGTSAENYPDKPSHSLAPWSDLAQKLLRNHSSVIVLGMDTVVGRRPHNSLVAWDADGYRGVYHKRALVPFGEYQPAWLDGISATGRSLYAPGADSQLIRAGELVLGGFICQEVLHPYTTRHSILDGANLLVSGGNDGVFRNPAVAELHAELARLRAVETGRYVVRAMRTGISAVINPAGEELVRAASGNQVLVSKVRMHTHLTPYVRFGNWVLWLAATVLLRFAATALRSATQSQTSNLPL